jgi:hypothetical protein
MSLHVVRPPARTVRAATRCLAHMKAGRGFLTRGALGASTGEALFLAAPHPVFNLGVANIRAPHALACTRMTGWRFIVLSRGTALATLEFAARDRRDEGCFSRVTDGRMAASSSRAIGRAEDHPLVKGKHYALGMIRVTALDACALWLRDLAGSGQHDLFAMVEPVPGPMTAERWMSRIDLMQGLQNVRML